jgi:hypothetical protein
MAGEDRMTIEQVVRKVTGPRSPDNLAAAANWALLQACQ